MSGVEREKKPSKRRTFYQVYKETQEKERKLAERESRRQVSPVERRQRERRIKKMQDFHREHLRKSFLSWMEARKIIITD
jgi:hypothetical protein